MLSGKNVLLAITGSIAAYKSAYLIREFIKKGAQVKVIVTESALQFVTKVTLSTLSKNPSCSHLVFQVEIASSFRFYVLIVE